MPGRSRLARPSALLAAALLISALTPSPAAAAVTVVAGTDTLTITSDAAGDTITLTCEFGLVNVSSEPTAIDCVELRDLQIYPGNGNDTIDLSALAAADFPSLETVGVASELLSGNDSVDGSFIRDVVFANGGTVRTFGGDDYIDFASHAFGGEGDDELVRIGETANGGPGDDRIVQPGSGPWDGGSGYDTVALDFTELVPSAVMVLTDTVFHIDAGAQGFGDLVSLDIERYEVTLGHAAAQSWTSSSYSGDTELVGGRKADVLLLGSGNDVIDARGGDDEITGGGGIDILRGGTGDDTIDARDGTVDRVACGDGEDTVVADFADVLSGCEHVDLPPPVTGTIKGPSAVRKGTTARFTFSSSTPGATFQCKVDKREWKACTSPRSIGTSGFAVGSKHVLKVRAVLGDDRDATPSTKSFTIVR